MIKLKNVSKVYSTGDIGLFGSSVNINKGEIVGVLGANGSGKTTLLKSIMGLVELDNGQITIDGMPVTNQYDRMAFITEEGSYFPQLTPTQYGEFLNDFFPNFNKNQFTRLLELFELQAHKKIKTFSKGQKSKLEICAGFSKGATYILMDEPFLGKDMFTRKDFLKLMVSQLKTDETILLSTHLVDEIENFIDRALILHKGRIKRDIYIDELREERKDLATVMKEVSHYQEDRFQRFME